MPDDGDSEQPNEEAPEDMEPSLDGQPIFNSRDPDTDDGDDDDSGIIRKG